MPEEGRRERRPRPICEHARASPDMVSRPKFRPERLFAPLDLYNTLVYYGTSRQLFFGKLGKFDDQVSGGQAAGLRGEA
jgi:hypothetical protein